VDTKKYGRLKTELNNAYMAGQNNYPKTVESAVTMLSHYMNDKGVRVTDEESSIRSRVGPPVGEPICDMGVWPLPVVLV
jgi:hypothetical protein